MTHERVRRLFISILILLSISGGADCTSPGGVAGQLSWFSVENKTKYCNGTAWIDTSVSVGASCTSTTPGTIDYSSGDLRYCNTNNWVSMKGPSLGSCVGTEAGTFGYDSVSDKYRFCDATNWYALGSGAISFCTALTNLGLTTNLKLCLDAGDAASYTSGQSWLDRSGGGYDFVLGGTSGVDSTDPIFNGTAGGSSSSEYWSFNPSSQEDYFNYDQASPEAWMNNIHKDGVKFTAVYVFKMPSTMTDNMAMQSTIHGGTDTGHLFYINIPDRYPVFNVQNAGAVPFTKTGTHGIGLDAWHMLAISLDESANSGFYYLDGAYLQEGGADTWTATYVSPAAGAATGTMRLAASRSLAYRWTGNSYLGGIMVWEGVALTKAQLDSVWAQVWPRYFPDGLHVVSAFQKALAADSHNWNGYTLRQRIPASQISGVSGSLTGRTRVTFQSCPAEGATIANAYIGHQGGTDAWDATSLTQLQFGGSASTTIAANSMKTSDWATFSWNGSSDLIVTAYFNNSASDCLRYRNSTPGPTEFHKSANEAGTADATGFTTNANRIDGVTAVEFEQNLN